MLKMEGVWKTFNAGTVNEKTALSGLSLELKEETSSRSSAATEPENLPC